MSLSLLRSLAVTDPLLILATMMMASISVALSFFDPKGARQHRVARRWGRMLLGIGCVRVEVGGLRHLAPDRNYVFAGNHLSLMDTPLMLANIPHQFLFLVNSKYVRLPFLGTHLRRGGHFTVHPDDTRASLKTMTEAARTMRERGLSVLLFPEGARARGELREFKEGAAYMSIKSGVPVVPFAIRGTREILPVGSLHVRGGSVRLLFGEPMDPAGLLLKDRAAFTAAIRRRVADLQAALESGQVPPALLSERALR